jgi:hypothetical protein
VDLRGFSADAGPVTPHDALGTLLLDSGVPQELVPAITDARGSLWRSRLAGQRALLVLDNAADAAHVRPPLPGTACVFVVVISRRKLTALEDVEPVSLGVMQRETAVALLTEVAGAARIEAQADAVDAAVELCGFLPAAIRVAAARLCDRTTWTVKDLIDCLHDDVQRVRLFDSDDRGVTTVLAQSHHRLPPMRQQFFRWLCDGTWHGFDRNSAAELTDVPPTKAAAYLQALFDDNLVQRDVSGLFHVHRLVRDSVNRTSARTPVEPEHRAQIGTRPPPRPACAHAGNRGSGHAPRTTDTSATAEKRLSATGSRRCRPSSPGRSRPRHGCDLPG